MHPGRENLRADLLSELAVMLAGYARMGPVLRRSRKLVHGHCGMCGCVLLAGFVNEAEPDLGWDQRHPLI